MEWRISTDRRSFGISFDHCGCDVERSGVVSERPELSAINESCMLARCRSRSNALKFSEHMFTLNPR